MKKTAALILALVGQHFLTIKRNYISRQQNDFHVYYEPPFFYFHREGIMRFRQLLPLLARCLRCISFGAQPIFVIRIGVESWPPLMMAGVRFPAAGILLMAFCYCADINSPRYVRCSMPR